MVSVTNIGTSVLELLIFINRFEFKDSKEGRLHTTLTYILDLSWFSVCDCILCFDSVW